jgi:cell division protein FtsA
MNGVSDYVVAIDLGSSSIVGGLGKKEEDGRIRILAMDQIAVNSEIRRGIVHNIEDVSGTVKDLITILSRSQEKPIGINHVYVGMNGYTTRTVDIHVSSYPTGDELFKENDLYELQDQVRDQVPDGLDVLDIFTQEFLVDGKTDLSPVGSMPKRVDAHYKVVGGKEELSKIIETTFSRIKLNYRTVLGPVASAQAVLRPDEKNKGVVCIDFGAETTSLCIYKNNLVRYVSILPFGGRSITHDLIQLNVDEDEAEDLKLSKGSAIHYTELRKEEGEEAWTKDDMDINEIVVARIEEIVENIWAQISRSGIEPQKLICGLVITGGASELNGLEVLLAKKTGMNVRKGDSGLHLLPECALPYGNPENAQCIGLLLMGEGGCCSLPEEEKIQEEPKPVDVLKEPVLDGFEAEKDEKKKKPVKVKEPKGKSFRKLFTDITDLFNQEPE